MYAADKAGILKERGGPSNLVLSISTYIYVLKHPIPLFMLFLHLSNPISTIQLPYMHPNPVDITNHRQGEFHFLELLADFPGNGLFFLLPRFTSSHLTPSHWISPHSSTTSSCTQ